jgi:hypothetical protein
MRCRTLTACVVIVKPVGDEMELDDSRAGVVGICEVTQTFQGTPVLYRMSLPEWLGSLARLS